MNFPKYYDDVFKSVLSQLLAATTSNNLPNKQQVRHLNVHEYVSYTLLRDAGIPVPRFNVAKTKEEVVQFAKELNTKDIVLKAQVRSSCYFYPMLFLP